MKVVIIGPAFPLRGGIADFNEALAIALQNDGNEVIIYSFYYQYPKILFPGKTQLADGGKPAHLKIKSTLSSVNPFSWRKTASAIVNEKPDLVIVRFWLPFMAPALGTVAKHLRKKNIKVIAITDNVIPHENRIGDSSLTKYFIKNCDAFITMSGSVLKDLEKFTLTDKKVFLPHPIYNIFGERLSKAEARKKINLPSEERIILFFGFIRKYKGLNLLLDAMADERIKQRNIKLLVAGEFYGDEQMYHDKIKALNIGENIILHTSFIDKQKVRDYFCSADLVVQPYITATQSGITQVAYYFGRPMLVTNVGGLSEIVKDRRVGYVTDVNSKAIADALCDFYDNNREMEFSANVDVDKEKFSWKYFLNGLKKLYESIK